MLHDARELSCQQKTLKHWVPCPEFFASPDSTNSPDSGSRGPQATRLDLSSLQTWGQVVRVQRKFLTRNHNVEQCNVMARGALGARGWALVSMSLLCARASPLKERTGG